MGKGGTSKGKGSGKVLKSQTKEAVPWRSSSGKSGGGKSGGKSGGGWVWVPETPKRNDRDSGKGKGKSKGKSKGKGKLRAAPLKSQFWEKKVEHEGRKELGDTAYPGTIQRYNWKQGWGFILPDSVAALPGQVKKKMKEAEAAAEAEGKEVKEKGLLYFRKPDVNHAEGFKLTDAVAVTFRVYVDDKGAGACDVSAA